MDNRKVDFDRLTANANTSKSAEDFDKALGLYNQAIEIAETNSGLVAPRVLADVFINCSRVYARLGHIEEALDTAAKCIRADDGWFKGFYQLGKVMKQDSRQDAEIPFLNALDRLRTSSHDDSKVEILEILAGMLANRISIFKLKTFHFHGRVWTKVLNNLAQKQEWISMSSLLLPQPFILADEADTSNIQYSTLLDLSTDDWVDWGELLVIALLTRGASKTQLVSRDEQVPILHAAMKLGMKHRRCCLLKWLLIGTQVDRNETDEDGNTLWHTLYKEVNTIDKLVFKELVSLLLLTSVREDIRNKDGMLYTDLDVAGNSDSDVLRKIEKMSADATKEAGNKKMKNALKIIEDAKYICREKLPYKRRLLAKLSLQRSNIYLDHGKLEKATAEVIECLQFEPRFFMVHMQMGIILKRKCLISQAEYFQSSEVFLIALDLCPSDADEFVELVEELVDVLPKIKRANQQERVVASLVAKNINVDVWSTVLRKLVDNNRWDAVRFLFSSPMLEKSSLVHSSQIKGVDCSNLLKLTGVSWKEWGECLLIRLLDRGCNKPNIHDALQLLFKHGSKTLFLWLLSCSDVNINDKDSRGNSLLQSIANTRKLDQKEKEGLRQILLKKGADETLKDKKGGTNKCSFKRTKTPDTAGNVSHDANKRNCQSCPKDMNAKTSHGQCSKDEETKISLPAYIRILERKHHRCISDFLPKIEEDCVSILFVNVGHGYLKDNMKLWNDVVKFLDLHQQANPKTESTIARTISLSAYLQSDCNFKRKKKRIDGLELMLRCGANPNGITRETAKPLQVAFSRADDQAVLCLIEHGADVNEVCRCDFDGKSIFHVALEMGLLKHSLDVFKHVLKSTNSEKWTYFKNVQDGDRNSLLHVATQSPQSETSIEAVNLLCKNNVNKNLKDKQGKTAMAWLKRNDARYALLKSATKVHSNAGTGEENGIVFDEKNIEVTERKMVRQKHRDMVPETVDNGLTDVKECEGRIRLAISLLEQQPPRTSQQQIAKDCKEHDEARDESEGIGDRNVAGSVDPSTDSEEHVGAGEYEDQQQETKEENVLSDDVDFGEFDSLPWEVECTSDVWKTLRSGKIKTSVRRQIVNKIKLLASGDWRDKLCKSLEGVPQKVKLFEARVDKKVRILWERAIAFSFRSSESPERRLGIETSETVGGSGGRIYSEIIRVWYIVFDHDNVNRTKDNIVKSIERGKTCVVQKNLKGISKKEFTRTGETRRELPLLFTESENVEKELVTLIPEEKLFPPGSANETEFHILKFYSFSPSLIATVLNDNAGKVDFPFRVSELEDAIINLKSKSKCAILLLGRSGTGKTTCCLYRLWTTFLNYWKAVVDNEPLMPRFEVRHDQGERTLSVQDAQDDSLTETSQGASCSPKNDTSTEPPRKECDHLHQIFITKNVVLCNEVKKNFLDMCHGNPSAANYVTFANDELPNRLQEVNDFAYPLFVTSRQFLILLDASLSGPCFFKRNEDGEITKQVAGWGMQSEDDQIPDLHDQYEDESDQSDGDDGDDDEQHILRNTHKEKEERDVRRPVTFEVFVNEIWPKMKGSDNFQPSLVWEEMMSFIKGSIEALETEKGFLSLQAYIELGKKRAPNFSELRSDIYELFKSYTHLLSHHFFFDGCDVVFHIYRRMKDVLPQWSVHEIYVDETQDFTQAELSLLLRCCQDPNRMFLTGDTAQNIMRGISFRFEDLKSLFFYARKSMEAIGKKSTVNIPKTVHKLPYNYRSHEGVLAMASSVVDLMTRYFPESFDQLNKDQGLFAGPKPVIFESCNFDELALVLRGNKRQTTDIEFGAHQVILVANDDARSRLPPEFNLCLVLTIYEAKGLEFDDILLYNFFKDSQVSKEWRVVAGYLKELQEQEPMDGERTLVEEIRFDVHRENRARPLEFDKVQHRILISELKNLYTAITRARVNVWIFDEDEVKRAPMFEYFRERGLAEVISLRENDDTSIDRLFMNTSSTEDWRKRAYDFYKNRTYNVAAKAFAKAGDTNMVTECEAHSRVLQVESTFRGNPKGRRNEFMFIADRFMQCGREDVAVKCLLNAKQLSLAAKLCFKLGMFNRAAKLFTKLGNDDEAANAFEKSGNFRKAVKILYDKRTLSSLEEALNIIIRYECTTQVTNAFQQYKGADIPQRLLNQCPRQTSTDILRQLIEIHKRDGNTVRMLKTIRKLPTDDEKLEFLRDIASHDQCLDEAVELLTAKGRQQEAAVLLRNHGHLFKAASVTADKLFQAECFLSAARRAHVSAKPQDVKRKKLLLARRTFRSAKDLENYAEASLLTGITEKNREQKRAILGEAYRYYNTSDNCLGMLETLKALEAKGEECTVVSVRMCAATMDKLLALDALLDKRALTVSGTRMMKSCLRYWGLSGCTLKQEALLEGYRVVHSEGSRFCLFVDSEFVSHDVYLKRVRNHLQQNVEELRLQIQTFLKAQLQNLQPCALFNAGYACTDAGHKHAPHDSKYLTVYIQTCVTGLMLHHVITKHGLKIKSDVDVFYQHLTSILFPARGHNRNIQWALVGEEMRQNEQAKQAALNYVDNVWYDLQSNNHDKWSCTDVYLLISTAYLLFGKTNTDTGRKFLAQAEKDYESWCYKTNKDASMVPVHIGIKCFKRKDGSLTFISYIRHLLNFYEQLHIKGDPLEAVGKMNQFWGSLCHKPVDPFYPTLANTCRLLEIELVLCLSLYARHSRSFPVLLPAGYLAQVKFWGGMNYQKGSKSMFGSVQQLNPHFQFESHLDGQVHFMLKLMCGDVNERFNIIFDSFSAECGHFLQSGESERVLILCLVIICNKGLGLPWLFGENIRQAIMDITIHSSIKYPARLLRCLTRSKEAKSPKETVHALAELIRERDDESLYTCNWKKGGGYQYDRKGDYNFLPLHQYTPLVARDALKASDQHQGSTGDSPKTSVVGHLDPTGDQTVDHQPDNGGDTSRVGDGASVAEDIDGTDDNLEDLEAVIKEQQHFVDQSNMKAAGDEDTSFQRQNSSGFFDVCRVDATFCGICGIYFKVERDQNLENPVEFDDGEEDFDVNTAVFHDEAVSKPTFVQQISIDEILEVTMETHMSSNTHWETSMKLNEFKDNYSKRWLPLINEIDGFLTKQENDKENIDVQRLRHKKLDFEALLVSCKDKHNWKVDIFYEDDLKRDFNKAQQSSRELQIDDQSDEDPDIERALQQGDDDSQVANIVGITEEPKPRWQKGKRRKQKKK